MESTKNFLDNKRSGKVPEKSNFASTCNLLTQYLKEKGKLKDLSRSINEKFEVLGKSMLTQVTETKNLLSSLGDLNQPPTEETVPMDNLPQYTTVVSVRDTEDCKNKASSSKEATSEGKSAQMTMFYDGKVWVFDSLPTEKAQELMVLASKGNNNSSTASGNVPTTSNAEKINLIGAVASTSSPAINLIGVVASTSSPAVNLIGAVASTSSPAVNLPVSKSGKEKEKVQSDANNSDLPIARRSSLHRFLEKRKERSSARAPYQVGHDAPGPSSKDDDQLELKL